MSEKAGRTRAAGSPSSVDRIAGTVPSLLTLRPGDIDLGVRCSGRLCRLGSAVQVEVADRAAITPRVHRQQGAVRLVSTVRLGRPRVLAAARHAERTDPRVV